MHYLKKELEMRIQNINQNNYENRNIGFNSTHKITVHIPHCKACTELCGDVYMAARKRALEKALPSIQEICGCLNFQRGQEVTFLIADKKTNPEMVGVIERLCDDSEQTVEQLEKDMLEIERVKGAQETVKTDIILTRDDVNLELEKINEFSDEDTIPVCEAKPHNKTEERRN